MVRLITTAQDLERLADVERLALDGTEGAQCGVDPSLEPPDEVELIRDPSELGAREQRGPAGLEHATARDREIFDLIHLDLLPGRRASARA